MNYQLELIMFFLSISVLLYIIFKNQAKSNSMGRDTPEPSGAWPIIGHLHLLGSDDQHLFRTLGSLADKYGPAFKVRLGTHCAFIVSSWEVAKECFTINDLALASRPKLAAMKHMCYNNAMFGMGPYTPYWREMRKIVTHELLFNRRLEMLKDVRLTEISYGISKLYGQWNENSKQPVLVKLNKWLEHMMLNIMVTMVAGKRYFGVGGSGDEGSRSHKAINDFFRLSGAFVVSDAIPFLWWLDLNGYEKDMKKTAKDFDVILTGWLHEHRKKKKKLNLEQNKNDVNDFMDVMLSLEDKGEFSNMEHDQDTIIKSTCMPMILGGQAIAVTLTWAISLLLNHPDVLKKLQDELDSNVGKERQVDESDIKNLVFLEATIKETLRLYPTAPLLAAREAREDCIVAGYNVKAGTRLIVNAWKLQRDEGVWSDPSKFQPERFMGMGNEHIDVRGQQFVLLPFGFGRRSCPAVSFALQLFHLILARLLHSFDLVHPGGLLVDLTKGPGMNLTKKKQLEVLLTSRLPSSIYA